MNFKDLILKRQSDRKYTSQKVERDKINLCIEAARLAPSAMNSQPWTFVIVDKEEKVRQIGLAASDMNMNPFAKHAPAFVAIVLEKPGFITRVGCVMKDKDFPLIDIGIAASYFCLQAADIGLGTCQMGWFNEKRVKELLGIPKSKRVPLLISIGYPDTQTRQKARKSTEKMCKDNMYE